MNVERAKNIARLRHSTAYEKFDNFFHDSWGVKKRAALNYECGRFYDGLSSLDEFNKHVDTVISSVNLNKRLNQRLFIQRKTDELRNACPWVSKSTIKTLARNALVKIIDSQAKRNEKRKKRVKIYFK